MIVNTRPFVLSLILIVLLFPLYTLSANQTYSIDTPKDWKRYHNAQGFNYVTTNSKGDSVIAVTTGPASVSLDQFFDQGVKILEKTVQGYQLIETGKANLNGVDSLWIIHKGIIQKQLMVFIQFFVIHKDLAYLITIQVPESQFAADREQLFKIANTFKILE